MHVYKSETNRTNYLQVVDENRMEGIIGKVVRPPEYIF